MTTLAEARAMLTSPGGGFEITTEQVGGVDVQVYAERFPSLRSVPEMAALRGDTTFIVHGDDVWSYARFTEALHRVANGLRDAGVEHGDRVAVLSQNNPEWCLSFWGAVTGGSILVGLNGWWKADEVLYGLQDSGAKVLVADRKRFERIAEHLDECPDLERIYLTSDADPERARARNAEVSRSAMNELRRMGIGERQIRLENLRIEPEHQYNPETRRSEQVGFQARREIRVQPAFGLFPGQQAGQPWVVHVGLPAQAHRTAIPDH